MPILVPFLFDKGEYVKTSGSPGNVFQLLKSHAWVRLRGPHNVKLDARNKAKKKDTKQLPELSENIYMERYLTFSKQD